MTSAMATVTAALQGDRQECRTISPGIAWVDWVQAWHPRCTCEGAQLAPAACNLESMGSTSSVGYGERAPAGGDADTIRSHVTSPDEKATKKGDGR